MCNKKNRINPMQISWIDPEEVGRLAAELQAPAVPDTDPEQGFLPGLTFLEPDGSVTLVPPYMPRSIDSTTGSLPGNEPAVAPEILHIREQLRQIRERAQQAGLIGGDHSDQVQHSGSDALESTPSSPEVAAPETVATPASINFLPLEGTMSERLDAFAGWASGLVASDELLLIDDRGDLLWSKGERSDLAISALLAVTSSLRSNALGVCEPPEIIRNKLNVHSELSVLPCFTRHGLVSLAIVNSVGIPQDTVGWLREALILTVEGRGGEDPSAL